MDVESLKAVIEILLYQQADSYKIDDLILKDSVGAGDCIISQLCSKGAESFVDMEISDIENALKYGQALGALNCCFDGTRG